MIEIHHLIKFKDKFYMGLDLVTGGTLADFLRKKFKKNEQLTDWQASRLIKGILEAIAYIHDEGIAHRDLKPGNILIADQNDLSTVKLIDFGLGLN